jgi:CheY-like chemotaxis protein
MHSTIEDDPNDVLLVEMAFRRAELTARLEVVRDGDEAIAYLSGHEAYAARERYPLPALVLLDLKLPGRSGLEVLSWVRVHTALKRLPIVMLTSSTHPADVNQAYDLGVNSYLVKPSGLEGLTAVLILKSSRASVPTGCT